MLGQFYSLHITCTFLKVEQNSTYVGFIPCSVLTGLEMGWHSNVHPSNPAEKLGDSNWASPRIPNDDFMVNLVSDSKGVYAL